MQINFQQNRKPCNLHVTVVDGNIMTGAAVDAINVCIHEKQT